METQLATNKITSDAVEMDNGNGSTAAKPTLELSKPWAEDNYDFFSSSDDLPTEDSDYASKICKQRTLFQLTSIGGRTVSQFL